MPTYVYKFVDTGETLEVQQSFSDSTLTEAVHPRTGATMAVKKVFQPVGVTFKGDGFYKTDNRGGAKAGAGAAKGDGTSGADTGGGTAKSTDTSGDGGDNKKNKATESTGKPAAAPSAPDTGAKGSTPSSPTST